MRKRIPCKIIKSVPLYKGADGLQRAGKPEGRRAKTRKVASLTYTNRLVITRASTDDSLTARTLDFCV